MRSLDRRVTVLEERLPEKITLDREVEAMRLATDRLEFEELELVLDVFNRTDKSIPKSEGEQAALDHFEQETAECLKVFRRPSKFEVRKRG
jgi:hypothetical protein